MRVTRRRLLASTAATAALPYAKALAQAAPAEPVEAPKVEFPRTLLLVDDHHVLYRPGTRRVLHPLKRHANNPLVRGREKPWEVAIAWSSVHRDDKSGRYQLWYQAYAGEAARERTHRCTVCYAESADGITWDKPNLGLHAFNDVKDTNIVLLANGGTSDRYAASVVLDPRDPDPSRRYKMAHFDFSRDETGREFPGLCVAFSPDGIRWTKHPRGPVLRAAYGDVGAEVPFNDEADKHPWQIPLSASDALDVFFDPRLSEFAGYGKMWIDGPDGRMYHKHAAYRTGSRDFVNWSRPQLVMSPDESDPPHVEFHTTPVFFHAGCYFAAPQILNRADRGGVMDVELATSRDGVNWRRPFRAPFWLARSAGETFDSGSLFTNATPVVLDDEIRFYYGGYSQGATGADDRYQISGIGLATARRDRFVGVRAIEKVGQITLKPIDLSGARALTLNADASKGEVRVELLDADGRRVREFAAGDAIPMATDSLRHAVRWRANDISKLAAGQYIPRIHIAGDAEVFAMTATDSSA